MGDFVQNAPVAQDIYQAPSQYDRGHDNHDKHHDNHQGYREKKSIWKELFD
jgi:Zn-finger nucleic acid-binding protein